MHATRSPTAPAATCLTLDELGHLLRWAAAAPDRRDVTLDTGGDLDELALIGPKGWAEWGLGREACGSLNLVRLDDERAWTVGSVADALARMEAAERHA